MTTRYTSGGENAIPSGYEGYNSDIIIPPCGISDVDRALFNMFDKELKLTVKTKDNELKPVPVMFATGEKWALFKNKRGLRDNQGTLILPLITITRTSMSQDPTKDIVGRGINQQTGNIIVKRKLSQSDRKFQNLINRLYIKNQQNLAVKDATVDSQLTTQRDIGDLADDVADGSVMIPDRLKNAWEIITLPAPQFYTALYEIKIWTQYEQHMNWIIEQIQSSFLPTSHATLKLQTPAGYWFIAKADTLTLTPEYNIDDMSNEERIVKYKFELEVPAYLLASDAPGKPLSVKRYVSSPVVSFVTTESDSSTTSTFVDEAPSFDIGADDPTLPIDVMTRKDVIRRDQRQAGSTLFGSDPNNKDVVQSKTTRNTRKQVSKIVKTIGSDGKVSQREVRVINSPNGERVYVPSDGMGTLDFVID